MSLDQLLKEAGSFSNVFKLARARGLNVEETMQGAMNVDGGLFRTVGCTVRKVGEGTAELGFGFGEAIERRGGMVHGGIVMYTLDNVCGIAVMTVNPGVDQLTSELKVNFLESLRNGPFVATGRVLRVGRSTAVAEGEIRDAGGALCAKGMGTWHLVQAKGSPSQA